jgi:hypothetical protein
MNQAAIDAAAAAAAAAANVVPAQQVVAANVPGPIAVANNPAPPGALANVPRFALNPADLNQNFFDYTTTEGRKHFERATEPLDTPYDGSSKGLNMFIHQVKSKASVCGWTNSIRKSRNDRERQLSAQGSYTRVARSYKKKLFRPGK